MGKPHAFIIFVWTWNSLPVGEVNQNNISGTLLLFIVIIMLILQKLVHNYSYSVEGEMLSTIQLGLGLFHLLSFNPLS